jgi:hypothetical protein
MFSRSQSSGNANEYRKGTALTADLRKKDPQVSNLLELGLISSTGVTQPKYSPIQTPSYTDESSFPEKSMFSTAVSGQADCVFALRRAVHLQSYPTPPPREDPCE